MDEEGKEGELGQGGDNAGRNLEVWVQPQAPSLTTHVCVHTRTHTHTHAYVHTLTLEDSKLKPAVFPPHPAI